MLNPIRKWWDEQYFRLLHATELYYFVCCCCPKNIPLEKLCHRCLACRLTRDLSVISYALSLRDSHRVFAAIESKLRIFQNREFYSHLEYNAFSFQYIAIRRVCTISYSLFCMIRVPLKPAWNVPLKYTKLMVYSTSTTFIIIIFNIIWLHFNNIL